MSANIDLTGLTILVTRPRPQGEVLCEQIRAHGGSPLYFPVLEIMPPDDMQALQDKLSRLERYQWLVFISPQAVYRSQDFLQQLPPQLKIAAVGGGTAQALLEAKLPVHCYPANEWSSEGLLALPEFQSVAGQTIAIIKGQGGRELLQETLTARGAEVVPIIAYQRVMPKAPPADYLVLLRNGEINVIICSSNEGLANLKILFQSAWTVLQDTPLVVISERMKKYAQELGFKKQLLAKNPGHAAILESIKGNTMANQEVTKTQKKPRRFPWNALGILSTALASVVLIFLFFATNYYYMHYIARGNSAQRDMQQLQSNFIVVQQELQHLNDEMKSQQEVINALRQTQSGYNRNEWRVLEAEFLVKLANDKLQLENNPRQAVILLQTADQQIRDVNDASLMSIRKALAADIAAVQAVPQVDIAGLYMRLAAINEQLEKLPLPNKPAENAQTTTAAGNANVPWWKRGLQDSWEELKRVVVVRYHQKGSPALIMPEQKDFLYQNMHASLEKAMWALLHQQPDIYRASLQQAINWVREYFVADAAVTQSIVENLTQLQAVDIHPALPAIAGATQAFQAYFAAQNSHVETQPASSAQ